MAIASKSQILKVLKAFNPWWATGTVHPSFTKTYRRFAYYEAMKRLDQPAANSGAYRHPAGREDHNPVPDDRNASQKGG